MILFFDQVGPHDLPRVGGKGANLGALTRAGFRVPEGFCVTTEAFAAFVAGCAAMPALYDRLDALAPDDLAAARALGNEVRSALLDTPLPPALISEVGSALRALGSEHAYAVRSSATAEDLPGASFAGQQDTYLNIRGEAALLDAIRRCFASLFTDRAIVYRQKGGFGHRGVALCVVVQRMVFPEAAGILFTADPVSGHRGTLTIDAGFGLGEALVGGLITADLYRVDKRTRAITEVRIGDKAVAIRACPEGGTRSEPLPPEQRGARVLDDDAVRALCELGERIERHYGGAPQDVEWCREGGQLYVVQARPITSLYPLPSPLPRDGALHVYLSFGHIQNMVQPFSPLGMDLWRTILPFGKTRFDEIPQASVLVEAGARLYLDMTPALRAPVLRKVLLAFLGRVYPDVATLAAQLAERPAVQAAAPPRGSSIRFLLRLLAPAAPRIVRQMLWAPPAELAAQADAYVEQRVRLFREQLRALPAGAERLRGARQLLSGVFQVLPRFAPFLLSAFAAQTLLRRRFASTPQAADVEALQRGLYGNITTEMDLQVADLADRLRPYPALIAALRRDAGDPRRTRAGLEVLREMAGGAAFLDGLDAFLQRFGMRGPAEIDIAQPRWSDQPAMLLNSILGGLAHDGPRAPGQHRAHFARQQAEGDAAGRRLIAAAGDGLTAAWVRRLVACVRYGLGVREHPKYLIVQCLAELRAVLRAEGGALAAAGRIDDAEDVWFLRYDELVQLVADPAAPDARPTLAARRAVHERARHQRPPLLMTSEGEVPQLPPPRDLPAGALFGLGASAGVVEGVARVIGDPASELLHAGEILVAPFTDPGWTPLFMHAAGLVCEVGGMMTHGSVVAREYGIPAVVGVAHATTRIRTGQRLRVDGDRGLIQVLEEPPPAAAAGQRA